MIEDLTNMVMSHVTELSHGPLGVPKVATLTGKTSNIQSSSLKNPDTQQLWKSFPTRSWTKCVKLSQVSPKLQ